MSQVSAVTAERALANRAHVRILLRLRQPAFPAGPPGVLRTKVRTSA